MHQTHALTGRWTATLTIGLALSVACADNRGAVDVDDDTGAVDTADTDPGTDTDTDVPPRYAPARYLGDDLLSPITPYVADRLAEIAARDAGRAPNVFMKVGASGTVSRNLLWCFAGDARPEYRLDWGGDSSAAAAVAYFQGGDAAGSTPFDRATVAAVSGRTASWAISGNPSPLQAEIAAVNPRYAFVNYGTNDMGMGATYLSALPGFYASMSDLLDQTANAGVIPLVTGLNPRTEASAATPWVPTYNAVTMGIAQARQVPFLNLYEATVDLPNRGLLSDGIHGNVYREASANQPCVFDADGLDYNYNVRNLLSISQLDTVWRVVANDEPAQAAEHFIDGDGSPGAPFLIDQLPFTHYADTSTSPHRLIDAYPDCDSGQDESGPEHYYHLRLDAQTPVRLLALDRDGTDVDVHVLRADGVCLARHDRAVQRTLTAGDYTIVIDTFVPSSGADRAGAYLFVAIACEPGDASCADNG